MNKNLYNTWITVIIWTFGLVVNNAEVNAQTKTTSFLWGENGELWDSRGRLPDFSYAGYGGGYAVKPTFSNTIDVTTKGVVPNDGKSDVAAITAIIKSAPNNSIIYFPAGRYVLDNWLKIERPNIILRGAGDGTNGTIFYMPKSATEINGSFVSGYNTGGLGQVIEFIGKGTSSTTKVKEEALRSDKVIVVEQSSKLKVGDIIEINAQGDNPVNGELWHEYFNNQSKPWPEPHVSWATGNGSDMYHTIEKIEGQLITLREPLRLKLKPSWEMVVRKANRAVENVGIEDIRIEFIKKPNTDHLKQPGYNAVMFKNCYNFWAKNLTIVHCDHGITIRDAAFGEVDDITMEGREGHHGFEFSHCASSIISNVSFNNTNPFTHSITINHKANGNVVRNIKGTQLISLDMHRNVPFSNLWTDIRTASTHQSSGDGKAGPHAAARMVYWGLYSESTGLYWKSATNWQDQWGIYQGTIVSALKTSEMFTEDREWYEHVPNLAEKDLYLLQKRYHAEFKPELVFSDSEYGNRSKWTERDASRWKVQEIEGEKYYSLFAKELPTVTTGKLPEYSVYTVPQQDVYEIETSIKCFDAFENRDESDLVLVISYINDDNYLFARVSTIQDNSGIYSVKNGVTAKLANGLLTLTSEDEVLLRLGAENNNIVFTMDGHLIAKAENLGNISFGKVGVGSSKNGVLFKNIKVNEQISPFEIVTSVNYFAKEAEVSVYPNPVNSILNIDTEKALVSYSLINMSGSVVATGNEHRINMLALKDGVYVLIILQENSIQYIKVIKTGK